MKKCLVRALLLLVILSGTMGAALAGGAAPDKSPALSEQKAKAALESLREAYQRGDLEAFMRGVSEQAGFNRLEFKMAIADRFTRQSSFELVFVTDHAVAETDWLSLKVHWDRRAVRKDTGETELAEGKAELLFKGEEAKLFDIRGDSPF